jgi:hypothetical protein
MLSEYPEGAGVCNSCHAPSASIDDLGIADIRSVEGVARSGVHCDYCHKIQDVTVEAVGLAHGRFATKLLRPHEGQLFFGPLDDVDRGEDSYLPLQSESQYCAVCHEGIVFGVPVYTTYSEWLQSPAAADGRSCQSCHMKPNGRMTNFAPDAGGIERNPSTLASHELLPGGREAMLRGCLEVTVSCHPGSAGTQLSVAISTRNVGHRVPTGFIDRHLILVVDLLDANGNRIDATGPTLSAAAGDFAGRSGLLFAKRLIDAEGLSPVPFWRAGTTLEDNRLEPNVPGLLELTLPAAVAEVRVRVAYRKFWFQTTASKSWPDSTLIVYDRTWLAAALLAAEVSPE